MNEFTQLSYVRKSARVDVTLLLEGSYPYVRGGMSTWVHQLITSLADIHFAVVFIGGRPSEYDTPHYAPPENLVHFEEHYIMETWERGSPSPRKGNIRDFKLSDEIHKALKSSERIEAGTLLRDVFRLLDPSGGLTRADYLYSQAAWNQICEYYKQYCPHPSFIDYFWTVRTIHAPLFKLVEIARHLPHTTLLHSVSTGYAGFVGALAHQMRQLPLVLTEHGIYTKERRIDIAQADWIQDVENKNEATLGQDISHFREMWIRFFEGLGHMIYAASDPIITLYEENRQRQLRDGAPAERTRVVPNGITLERYRPLRENRPETIPSVLTLIGRIVPIKDIKTFIRAMRTIRNRIPEAEGWIVGPIQEDPVYAQECRTLAKNLGLEDCVKFLGFQKVEDILPQVGLNVLTSISEAQPLVLMEGFAAGVPAVTTDVGACREMLLGSSAEDRALGAAGRLVPIASPGAFANAAMDLIRNPQAWHACAQAAIQRAETYYSEQLMFDRYREIYLGAAGGSWVETETYSPHTTHGEAK